MMTVELNDFWMGPNYQSKLARNAYIPREEEAQGVPSKIQNACVQLCTSRRRIISFLS